MRSGEGIRYKRRRGGKRSEVDSEKEARNENDTEKE